MKKAVKRIVRSIVPEPLLSEIRRIQEYRKEEPYLRKFRDFYAQLPDKDKILFAFFTSDMLHWVAKWHPFIPRDVNLVLIGANLAPEEIDWVKNTLERPFYHIDVHFDDNTAWRFIFETAERSFGWIDVDCFVFNPALFREMAEIGPRTAVNSIWSYTSHERVDILKTFWVYLNMAAIQAVRNSGVTVSPSTYTLGYSQDGREEAHSFSRMLSKKHIELMRPYLKFDRNGRPLPPQGEIGYWDTIVVFQLVAKKLGYELNKVRDLATLSGTPENYSKEVVHIGGSAYFKEYPRDGYMARLGEENLKRLQRLYKLHVQFRHQLLVTQMDVLPARYQRLLSSLEQELKELEIDRERAGETLRDFFREMTSTDEVYDRLFA